MANDENSHKIALLEYTENCIERAKSYLELYYPTIHITLPTPKIAFTIKGRKAGVANLTAWTLNFNLTLLNENGLSFIHEVVPHEVAHLVVYKLNPKAKPHGKEWQMVMENIYQLPAHRTHNFNTHSVSGKTFLYRCDCKTHQLTIRRHNRILHKNGRYICRSCKTDLTPCEPSSTD